MTRRGSIPGLNILSNGCATVVSKWKINFICSFFILFSGGWPLCSHGKDQEWQGAACFRMKKACSCFRVKHQGGSLDNCWKVLDVMFYVPADGFSVKR
jgi:hypothetical protein